MNTITGSTAEIAGRASAQDLPVGALDSAFPSLSLRTMWTLLRFTFGLVPIVAGFDKFTNILVNWESYLNPLILRIIPVGSHAFMGGVGVIEMSAGILTFARPRLGGFIVAAWLTGIALSLIVSGRYLDVAVRDLVMAIAAFTLSNLSATITTIQTRRPQ